LVHWDNRGKGNLANLLLFPGLSREDAGDAEGDAGDGDVLSRGFCRLRAALWMKAISLGLLINLAYPRAIRVWSLGAARTSGSGLSASFPRRWSNILGMSILTGQASRQAPQRLDA
jgi:hypothetical protein